MSKRAPIRTIRTLSALALLMPATIAAGKEIEESLPEQSVLYLEYVGADRCGEAMVSTPFGRVWDLPGVLQIKREAWKALRKTALEDATDDHDRQVAEASFDIAELLWRKGITINVMNVAMGESGPTFNLVAAVDAGDQCAKLVSSVERLIELCPLGLKIEPSDTGVSGARLVKVPHPAVPPIAYATVGDTFWVYVGPNATGRVAQVASGEASALTSNEQFIESFKKVSAKDGQPIFKLRIDAEELLTQARAISEQMTGKPGLPMMFESVLTASGLSGLHSFTLGCQIVDGGFHSTTFIDAPGNRKGLMKLFEQAPLTDADLIWLPKGASFATAINFDWAAAYDEIMRVLSVIPFPVKHRVEEATGVFRDWSGLDLRNDVLAALGDGVAVFDAADAGGVWFSGVTYVLEVRDESTLSALIDRSLSVLISKMDNEPRAEVLTANHGEFTIHYLQFRKWPVPLAPAWSFVNGRMVFALTPQTLKGQIDRVSSDDARSRSLLASENYQELRKQLSGDAFGIQYCDTARGLDQVYRYAILGSIAGISAAREYGVDIDATMVPTIGEITRGVGGHLNIITADESGIMHSSHGSWPFPVPSIGVGTGVNEALMISILLPSLSRARELSKRLVSQANLKGIGTACYLYAEDHGNKLPDSLDQLVEGGYIVEKQLNAPSAGPGVRSYTYVADIPVDMPNPQAVILAYEEYPGMTDEGANVLFLDGHVEFVKEDRLAQVFANHRAQSREDTSDRSARLTALGVSLSAFFADIERLPESLDELVDRGYAGATMLKSPAGGRIVLVEEETCDSESTDEIQATIVAHEDAGAFESERLCALFCDLHVECLPRESIAALLQKSE